ncbi:MAG: ABC transporter permease [Ignisphaera sp.]|uniref:ABC transporter permease n=1 Tax=Ignisphaera aggregans TaxID=334771 RepID=A0A7C4NUB6_9CREN
MVKSRRLLKFVGIRVVSVAFSVVIAILLTIVIANLGGKVDEIVKAEAEFYIWDAINRNPALRSLSEEERANLAKQFIENELRARGLDKPFAVRIFIYLKDALSLNLGRSMHITSNSGSRQVRIIIGERIPPTVLLFTTANLLIFFIELFGGLYLSRKYGSLLDKLIIALAPLSSMPGWFYGIFMILIFAAWLCILPWGGMVDAPPPQDPLMYALSVLKHMVLPMISWLIAYVPIGIYNMRTFFLMFSTEEYVEYARVRGVPGRIIERRYILRPTLPPIVTNFVLVLISSWMGAIVTESIFNWPGLGKLLYTAINPANPDPPVVIGVVTIYAYLLGVSVIALDIAYALIDPRIRVEGLGG